MRTINVADFGIPSGDPDRDFRAVQQAVDECGAAGEPARIVFPAGLWQMRRPIFLAGDHVGITQAPEP